MESHGEKLMNGKYMCVGSSTSHKKSNVKPGNPISSRKNLWVGILQVDIHVLIHPQLSRNLQRSIFNPCSFRVSCSPSFSFKDKSKIVEFPISQFVA